MSLAPDPNYRVPQAASPDHEILTVHSLPYPRARVFAAWTHPDLHAQWWGPAGFTNTFYNYDVRPGGEWRFTMHGPDGTDFENHSEFAHVVEGECLVFDHVTNPQFTVVVHFSDDGDGTRLEWHMIFEDAKTCAAIRSFVGDKNQENLARLEALLRDTPADAACWRELVVLREFPVAPQAVWRALTQRTAEWWCPRPWTTPVVDWDLRAGGRCRTVMRGPGGEEVDLMGTILEVTENERLVFTDSIKPGWQPASETFMIGVFELSPLGEGGTSYRASSRHWTDEATARHATMGFRAGWGAVADQLLEVSRDEAGRA
ncbi:SRPBCC domain-containing protein [Actomonas aquatica]|uniref:SRPBCC domain-containing protein n=1 Tax=Actomonas aquatica TaxID=2866162 RepID=A0ABZ1C7R3_9BACT|nr:SRPBCC domain-containing protein [Opitutus sp. WL0086]WRQ87452.1 SRPBCC domain-containing protein [Opitutus sp. WL0086]